VLGTTRCTSKNSACERSLIFAAKALEKGALVVVNEARVRPLPLVDRA